MSALLLTNAREVFGAPTDRGALSILIEGEQITAVSALAECEYLARERNLEPQCVDCSDSVIVPGFIDCHTHLVFTGTRERELYLRAANTPYLEILRQGGGIHQTVQAVHEADEDELVATGRRYLDQALALGITTVEIKSGYGLDTENESKLLRAIQRLKGDHPIDVVPTFLVHSVPLGEDRQRYLNRVVEEMIPAFRPLADWFDIFVEEGVFDIAESRRMLKAAAAAGYCLGLHTNQMHDIGGVGLALETGVRHVDHLEVLSDSDARALIDASDVYAVFLPGAEYCAFSPHIGQIHKLLNMPERLVLSSDFNPGSSPILSPMLVMAMAVWRYRLTDPDLLVRALTINPARMLGFSDRGEIRPGTRADLVCLALDNSAQIPYLGTLNCIRRVYKNGRLVAAPMPEIV
ncbi:imidazolonepropionase [candidate division KSB1 bacterium]|nr:imidazolonepropionase [candidate division KSB1 bacterium]